jgi:hypothetical protein
MNVVQIGDVTYGKNVASITLYDSPTFGPTKEIQITDMPCSLL